MHDRPRGPMGADLVVVGGGPAGWAAAIRAAELGLEVVLVERRAGAVDKACGEGLLPPAVAALRRLGVSVTGHELHGITYARADGSAPVQGRFRSGGGLAVRRTDLSAALSCRGAEVGVEVVRGFARAAYEHDGRVCVQVSLPSGAMVEVRGAWLAVADGLHSQFRRSLGLGPPPPGRGSQAKALPAGPPPWIGAARPPRYGLRRHFRLSAPDVAGHFVRVFWAEPAEAYVTPLADGVVNVAILGPGGKSFESSLGQFPGVSHVLAGAVPVSPVRGAGPFGQYATARRRGRVFLVGDAAAYTDALTGEGIAAAVASGVALAECLAVGKPDEYDARWRSLTRPPRLRAQGLLLASATPRRRRLLLAAARRSPRTFEAIVNAFA